MHTSPMMAFIRRSSARKIRYAYGQHRCSSRRAGGRVDATGSGKRDHKDFALWKQGKEGGFMDIPWGDGRGWHISVQP